MPDGGARRAQAVEAARDVFHARGYEDASIADIVRASGLNRYALYSEFGGKRELFLACVEDFVEQRRRRLCPVLLDQATAPFERLRVSSEMLIDDIHDDQRGCLVAQTALEVAREDPMVAEIVRSYFEEFAGFLAVPLKEAAERGELNPNVTAEKAAGLLMSMKISLNALARAGAPRQKLKDLAETALSALCTVASQKN